MMWCMAHPWMTFFLLALAVLALTLASLFRSFTRAGGLRKEPETPEPDREETAPPE